MNDNDLLKFDAGKKFALYGLIVCGGDSTRMGVDKSILLYHNKPQYRRLYEMLELVCEKVFLCCKQHQVTWFPSYFATLPDLVAYDKIGPAGALLTALHTYPQKNFLFIGCDYPFLKIQDVGYFMNACGSGPAAAFFNKITGFYEPLLAFYHHSCAKALFEMYDNQQHSLQQFLKKNKAIAYCPKNIQAMQSVDTPEEYNRAIEIMGIKG